MTCIAVVRDEINNKIFMAGDRGASDDGTILALSSPKVWKLGPYLIGYAGSMDGERIRYNFNPYVPDIKDTDKFMQTKFIKQLRSFYNDFWVDTSKEGDLGLIIAVRGNIYEHSSADMSLSKYTLPYLAMGSGAEYAYGYMNATEKTRDARKRVVGAVNSAIKFSPSCMGPVDVVSVQEYTYNMHEEDSTEDAEFGIWLRNGIERGWISDPYCNTHDGGYEYMGEDELQEWDEGGDPCCHVVRLMI